MRFELTAGRICNPVHWATLSPVHTNLAEHIGFEPMLPLLGGRLSKPLPSTTRPMLQISINCIVLLWTTITLLSFAFNVSTYMEHPSMLDPISLREPQA